MAIHVIDVGNTRLKWGVFTKEGLREARVFQSRAEWKAFANELPEEDVIVRGAVGADASWMESLNNRRKVFSASTNWNLPITSSYDTMDTLGVDRLAAVCGAYRRHSASCLVLDAGTCLTIDFVDGEGVYQGGNISPGWQMRMKAMQEGTENLPRVKNAARSEILGKSTKTALQGGGFFGYIFEIQGYVRTLKEDYSDLNVLLTGGDAYELAKYLKLEIFVEPNLVLVGLHEMYKTHYA